MRAVIYARYSSDLQSDRSIEDQVRDCRALAARSGWTVAEVYTDHAISGATLLRPGVQALLEHAAAGRFDVVLAEALDRLSRDLGDTAQLYKLLAFHQVKLVTISEGEVSQLHVGFKGTMNAQFLADLALKIRRGQRGNIEQGLASGGLTYGYEVVREFGPGGEIKRGRRRIREDQAAVVRRIFTDYVAGLTPLQIARALNAEGVPAMRGGKWRPSTIGGHRQRKHGILHNELYIGVLIGGRTSKAKDPATAKHINRLQAEKDWRRVPVPDLRIVDDETWKAAHAVKLGNGGGPKTPSRRRRSPHLLSDLVHCAACGGRFVQRDAARLTCAGFFYDSACTNNRRVRRAWLEGRVLEELGKLLADPANVARWTKRYHEQRQSRTAQVRVGNRALVKELGDVKAKIARLIGAIADGESAAPASALKLAAELERRQGELEAAIAAADDGAVVQLRPEAHEIYASRLADLAAALRAGSAQHQARARAILRRLIERIEILPPAAGDVSAPVEWRFVGKLEALLQLASGERRENISAPTWGYKVVRVEGDGLIPPPRIDLKFRA
jgi:site-specific DNA recombinase